MTLRRAPRIRVETGGAVPRITVRLPLQVEAQDACPYAELLMRDITTLLLKLQQCGLDPLDIAARTRIKVPTLRAWRRLEPSALYARAEWVVELA